MITDTNNKTAKALVLVEKGYCPFSELGIGNATLDLRQIELETTKRVQEGYSAGVRFMIRKGLFPSYMRAEELLKDESARMIFYAAAKGRQQVREDVTATIREKHTPYPANMP